MSYVKTRRRARVRSRRSALGGATLHLASVANRTSATRDTSTVPLDPTGYCTPDGQFIYDTYVQPPNAAFPSGYSTLYLRRKTPADVCKGTTGQNPTVNVHNADGSITTTAPDGTVTTTAPPVTDAMCAGPAPMISATPPGDGIAVDLVPMLQAGSTSTPIPGDGKTPITILLAATDNTPVTYYLCGGSAANPLALTSMQRAALLARMIDSSKMFYWTDNDTIPSNDVIKGWTRGGDIKKAVIAGRRPIGGFLHPDGTHKDLYVQMGFDQGMNTFALFYNTHPSAWDTINNFVHTITPFNPDPLLCKLLPIASKVPNPYFAAASIGMQLSGNCPASCPPGMTMNPSDKTQCLCPPGTQYNPATQLCQAPPGSTLKNLLPVALVGGAALLLIALMPSRKASS